jgi:hypothetical protein
MVSGTTAFLEMLGALAVMGLMALALRWTWGTGKSVPTARLADPDDPTNFGLLEEVSRVPSPTAAEVLSSRLRGAGIRSTVSRAEGGGYRLLVFPNDLVPAKTVLSRGAIE